MLTEQWAGNQKCVDLFSNVSNFRLTYCAKQAGAKVGVISQHCKRRLSMYSASRYVHKRCNLPSLYFYSMENVMNHIMSSF